MKPIVVLLAAVFLVASLAVATSASAEVAFNGTFGWTAVSNCQKIQVGAQFNSVYHPRLAGTNADYTSLSNLLPIRAAGYILRADDFSSTFKDVEAVGIALNAGTWTGTQVRITSRTPATIADTTRTVMLRGQIKNPGNDPGLNGQPCIATFEASYIRGIY